MRADRPARGVVTTEPGAPSEGGSLSTRRAVESVVLPTLRAVLASAVRSDGDTIAAATLAVAKTTDDPADVLRIVATLSDANLPSMARESATLALGCLRRTRRPAAFDGAFYDGVRATLFDVLADRRQPTRTRCFAALSIGLLGDQPVREDDVFAKDGRLAIRGLWLRLDDPATDDETAVSLLVALSLQNPAGVPAAVREGLRRLVVSGNAGHRRRGSIARSHALLALARIGEPEDVVGFASALLRQSGDDPHLRRSAVIALGLLAPRTDVTLRIALARDLLAHARTGEPNTAGLALISAARLVSADFCDGVATDADVSIAESVADFAAHGSFAVQPFAAIATGLLVRVRGRAIDDLKFVTLRDRVLATLRTTYADEGEDAGLRGAFALGLGIAADVRAEPLLEANVAARKGGPELATWSCAGLGLLGGVPESARKALRAALSDRSSDDLRREAARALGMVGDASAVPMLLAELESGGSDHMLARASVALGSIHDLSAVTPLSTLARRKDATDATRALACAGLGLLCDPETVPSLSHLGIDSNYLARTDALDEALSLL